MQDYTCYKYLIAKFYYIAVTRCGVLVQTVNTHMIINNLSIILITIQQSALYMNKSDLECKIITGGVDTKYLSLLRSSTSNKTTSSVRQNLSHQRPAWSFNFHYCLYFYCPDLDACVDIATVINHSAPISSPQCPDYTKTCKTQNLPPLT